MQEITKQEFLEKFGSRFSGNDINGYVLENVYISVADIKNLTNGIIENLNQLSAMCTIDAHDNDDWIELHNCLLANILGDGENYQGSYEEYSGSGDYNWYLDFGSIEIPHKKGFIYSGVRFYQGD
jgi:hypothetical protein